MLPQALANQEFCFAGPANPYTSTWVKATPNLIRQADAYDSDPAQGVTWWNITVNVVGEMYLEADPFPVSEAQAMVLCQQARSSGNRHSILKCELTYPLGNSKIRTIRFDIGSGVDVLIPTTWKIDAIFLRPEVVGDGPSPVPAGFNADAYFVSDFIITARCVSHPVRFPGAAWTDQFAVVTPGDFIRDFQVQEGAFAVSADFSAVPTNPLQFIWQRRTPDGAILDETVLGVASVAAGMTTLGPVNIPAGTNIIRYANTTGPFPIQGNIRQILEF